jgi:predicted transcriptional regulator
MARAAGSLEHEVLRTLWGLGRGTIRDVHEIVGAPRSLSYMTTAKVRARLEAKGIVQSERDGRANVYRARKRPRVVERTRIRALVERILGGEPEPAVAGLVDALQAIDPGLLDRVSEEIAARERGRRGS